MPPILEQSVTCFKIAVVGGTASAASGGKFANGAVTGSFVMLFNEMMHPEGGKGTKPPVDDVDLQYATAQGISLSGLAASGGEYLYVVDGMWKGANGKWNALTWGGNQYTGARSIALNKAGVFRYVGRGAFYLGAGFSFYNGYEACMNNDYSGMIKAGIDGTMGYVATFCGPPGWIIGGGYFLLDALGAFDRPANITPYTIPFGVRDNTNYVPPLLFPKR